MSAPSFKYSEYPLVCGCGNPKDRRAKRCVACYRPKWQAEEDALLRELVAAGWEYTAIARKLHRTTAACLNRRKILGLIKDPAAILENRKRGRERFWSNPAKVERRKKRQLKNMTPTERAIRAEELRLMNLSGKTGLKGKHHTPEVCERIRAAQLGRKHSPETKRKMSEANKAWRAAKRDGGQAALRQAMLADKARLNHSNDGEQQHVWCGQCERQVALQSAAMCSSPFCKAKALAA